VNSPYNRRTTCAKGHNLENNSYRYVHKVTGQIFRGCKTCKKMNRDSWRANNKEKVKAWNKLRYPKSLGINLSDNT
jgi:hypothetical protein